MGKIGKRARDSGFTDNEDRENTPAEVGIKLKISEKRTIKLQAQPIIAMFGAIFRQNEII
jgi:hypothetical protein